jgi:hypothetical protein
MTFDDTNHTDALEPEYKLMITLHLWQPDGCTRDQFEHAARAAMHDAVMLLFTHLADVKAQAASDSPLQRDASDMRAGDVLLAHMQGQGWPA